MRFLIDHTVLYDLNWWHLLAVLFLVVAIIVYIKKVRKMKDEEEDLENQISSLQADEIVKAPATKTSEPETTEAKE